jgi:hypothetical protein
MSETIVNETVNATLTQLPSDAESIKARLGITTSTAPVVKHSTGSAKSQFDSAVSILSVLGEVETSVYWTENRNRVLSAFGSVRTKSADGEATSKGVDFGSASLAKVLKHLSTPKREAALLSAAWAMASAVAMK